MAVAETQVPPQNLEAEESVLGALMVSQAAFNPVMIDVKLDAQDFYRERHRLIFKAIRTLDERHEPIDALTVSELLRQHGELEEAGGEDSVSHLASTVPAPGNAGHYARIVQKNALLRRLLDASRTIQQSVHGREAEPNELAERAERLLFEVAHEQQAEDFRVLGDILEGELEAPRRPRQRADRGHRDAVRLQRARRHHRRLPAGQPDHPRRPAGHG